MFSQPFFDFLRIVHHMCVVKSKVLSLGQEGYWNISVLCTYPIVKSAACF